MSHEMKAIDQFRSSFQKSKKQIHAVHESDIEVIKLGAQSYLCSSVDTVSEEIAYGLYTQPETMAWVSVNSTLSDFAAAGVVPDGFLLSLCWKFGETAEFKQKISTAMNQALRKHSVALVGGDTGEAAQTILSGSAVAVSKVRPVSRIGMKAGDWLCSLGDFGIGPALGFRFLLQANADLLPEHSYRPLAQLAQAPQILKYATAAMDTSDGMNATLHQLAELNEVKFELYADAVKANPLARKLCSELKLPELTLWFGEHGDFQVLFTVKDQNLKKVLRQMKGVNVIGRVLPKKSKEHQLVRGERRQAFDPGLLANQSKSNLSEIKKAFDLMVNYCEEISVVDHR